MLKRRERLVERTRILLAAGDWWTIQAMAAALGCTQTGASARFRDLRKAKYGGHEIVKRLVGGIFEYRMVPEKKRLGRGLAELTAQPAGKRALRKLVGREKTHG